MRPKLLTLRQQLGIFNCADPVAVMREYVSYSRDVRFIAQIRLDTDSLEEFIDHCREIAYEKEFAERYQDEEPDMYIEDYVRQRKAERAAGGEEDDPTTETQKQMFQNLSEKDANDIFFEISGHIYPEVLIKMLDTFPKEVSKELLLEYGKHCYLDKEVIIRAISVLGDDAKEIIYTQDYIGLDVFNKMFRVYGREETKKIIMKLAGTEHNPHNLDLCEDVELKLFRLYSKEDLKDILKCFIENSIPMDGRLFCKIFDVCATKEEIRELLDLALENDMDIWFETLDKIVSYFPKEEAKDLLDAFFNETSPGSSEYSDEEKEEYYNKLLTDEEREALEDEEYDDEEEENEEENSASLY